MGLVLNKDFSQLRKKQAQKFYWLDSGYKRGLFSSTLQTTIKFKDSESKDEIRLRHSYFHYPDIRQLLKGHLVFRILTDGEFFSEKPNWKFPPIKFTVTSAIGQNSSQYHRFQVEPIQIKYEGLFISIGVVTGEYEKPTEGPGHSTILIDSVEFTTPIAIKLVGIKAGHKDDLVDSDRMNMALPFSVKNIKFQSFDLQLDLKNKVHNLPIEKIRDQTPLINSLVEPVIFEVEKLRLGSKNYALEGGAQLSMMNDKEFLDNQQDTNVIDYLKVNAELKIAKESLNYFIDIFLRTKLATNVIPTKEEVKTYIKMLYEKSYLILEGNDYVLRYVKKGLNSSINGSQINSTTVESIKDQDNETLYNLALMKGRNAGDNELIHHEIIDLMDLMIQRAPQFAPAYYLKALTLRRLGQLSKGEQEIDQALILSPHQALYMIEKANFLNSKRQQVEALDLVNKVLQEDPRFPRALLLKAIILVDSKKVSEAEVLLHEVISDPNDHFIEDMTFSIWERIYKIKKMPKEEEELYLKVLKKYPSNPWGHLNYADFLRSHHRNQEALVEVDRCLALSVMAKCRHIKATVMANLGEENIKADKLDSAFVYFEKALKIEPENGAILNGLGQIYLKKNDETRAFDYFVKGCNYDDPSACSSLGKIYKVKKNFTKAKEYSDKACKLSNGKYCEALK